MLLGGWVLAPLPASTATPWPLDALRAEPHAPALALGVVIVGLGLVALAWGRLLYVSHVAPDLALVRRCALAWVAPLVLAPPLFSLDGWAYAAQGALVAAGLSPYTHGPVDLGGATAAAVDPRWMATPAPYGPLPLAYGGLLAHLTTDPLVLVIGHRLAALAGLALLGWAMPRLAAQTGAFPAPATAVVLASPVVVGVGIGGLHNDMLMIGLLAAAAVVAGRRWVLAAVLVGLAAAVKAPALLIAPPLALVALPPGVVLGVRLRRLVGFGAVTVAVVLAAGLVTGLGVGWLGALGAPGSVLTELSPIRLVPGALRGLVSALPVVAALVVGLVHPTGRPVETLRWSGLLLLLAALVGSALRLWYLLWPVAFLAVVPLPPGARRTLIAALALLGLVAPLTDHPGGDVLAYAAAPVVALTAAVVLAVSRRLRVDVLEHRPVVPQLEATGP